MGDVTYMAGQDGVVVATEEGQESVRYVKESDLLAVKGGAETKEKAASEAATTAATALTEATGKVEVEHNLSLRAEARITGLEEQIKAGGGSAAELAAAKAELETAKKSGEEHSASLLTLRREVITAKYGVPATTVETKDLAALAVYEEALNAVIGDKKLGNFAVGAGGGGAQALEGKSPMTLAQDAYATSNR
ncbi:hypothetical protein LCGC14_2258770 [marine sediment metagenome]|uniref:Uncharacterized protein n=1 Tax=marine sediment metagenome TaxID=412755 RepID=A0A0F9FVD0_9ZZZZ